MLNYPYILSRNGAGKTPNSRFRLMSQFFKSPHSVGTIVPSSRDLAELMIEPVDFGKPAVVVEFGPGTGSITTQIAAKLTDQTRYIGLEINKEFCKDLTARFPHLSFVNRSAAEIDDVLKLFAIDKVDAIVCGIPWASLPVALQNAILDGVERSLKPGGVFLTYAYLQGLLLPGAWALRRNLKARFTDLKTSRIVWNNVPPAFVYVCRK